MNPFKGVGDVTDPLPWSLRDGVYYKSSWLLQVHYMDLVRTLRTELFVTVYTNNNNNSYYNYIGNFCILTSFIGFLRNEIILINTINIIIMVVTVWGSSKRRRILNWNLETKEGNKRNEHDVLGQKVTHCTLSESRLTKHRSHRPGGSPRSFPRRRPLPE